MNLEVAVLSIADAMAEEGASLAKGDAPLPASIVNSLLRTFAGQLRVAAEAHRTAASPILITSDGFLDPESSQLLEIAQRAAERERKKSRAEEASAARLIVVADGPAAGDTVPVDPSMPVGARTVLDGAVYVLGDDLRLFLDQSATPPKKPIL